MTYEARINYPLAEGFEIRKDGVWFLRPKTATGHELEETHVCGLLYVIAYARDGHHENYCKLLEFMVHPAKAYF